MLAGNIPVEYIPTKEMKIEKLKKDSLEFLLIVINKMWIMFMDRTYLEKRDKEYSGGIIIWV